MGTNKSIPARAQPYWNTTAGWAANVASSNPFIGDLGELLIEDTGGFPKGKFGDGVNNWAILPYITGGVGTPETLQDVLNLGNVANNIGGNTSSFTLQDNLGASGDNIVFSPQGITGLNNSVALWQLSNDGSPNPYFLLVDTVSGLSSIISCGALTGNKYIFLPDEGNATQSPSLPATIVLHRTKDAISITDGVRILQLSDTSCVLSDASSNSNTLRVDVSIVNDGANRNEAHSTKIDLFSVIAGVVKEMQYLIDTIFYQYTDGGTGTLFKQSIVFTPKIGYAGAPLITNIPNYRSGTLALIGDGIAPVVAPNAGAGTGASTLMFATSDDIAGTVQLTTGTGTFGGSDLFTVTFNTPYAVAPKVMWQGANGLASANAGAVFVGAITTAGFTLHCTNPLTVSQVYDYSYSVNP